MMLQLAPLLSNPGGGSFGVNYARLWRNAPSTKKNSPKMPPCIIRLSFFMTVHSFRPKCVVVSLDFPPIHPSSGMKAWEKRNGALNFVRSEYRFSSPRIWVIGCRSLEFGHLRNARSFEEFHAKRETSAIWKWVPLWNITASNIWKTTPNPFRIF